ncbi:hypothetical protein KY334_02680 [Candidatus Woesearchaeota archaeon]|nr:hypothetical protein [Candidatus Woesearchaeota archaeon]
MEKDYLPLYEIVNYFYNGEELEFVKNENYEEDLHLIDKTDLFERTAIWHNGEIEYNAEFDCESSKEDLPYDTKKLTACCLDYYFSVTSFEGEYNINGIESTVNKPNDDGYIPYGKPFGLLVPDQTSVIEFLKKRLNLKDKVHNL